MNQSGYLIESFGIWRAYVPEPGRLWTGPGAGHPDCEACKGIKCEGGLNVRCRQRESEPSYIAGIIRKSGDLHIIVASKRSMRANLSPGDRLIVRKDAMTWEPIAWDNHPALIYDTWKYVLKELAPDNACGECVACCITLRIESEEFTKPSHTPCHACTSVGCNVYWRRPKPCRDFACVWLKSQKLNDRMGPELRPDKCGVIFVDFESIPEQPGRSTPDPLVFEVHPNFPGAENNLHVVRYINEMQAAGWKAKRIVRYEGEP